MSDSPTPRTDEANQKWPMDRHTLAFARQIEQELAAAKHQNITLSKALNDGRGDACVDSGEFTYNDWMEIRRRLMEELETAKSELSAWHSQFGTTLLSHATETFRASLDAVKREEMKRSLEFERNKSKQDYQEYERANRAEVVEIPGRIGN